MNLEKLNVTELNAEELVSIDGGRRRKVRRNKNAGDILNGLVEVVEAIGDFFNVSEIQGDDPYYP